MSAYASLAQCLRAIGGGLTRLCLCAARAKMHALHDHRPRPELHSCQADNCILIIRVEGGELVQDGRSCDEGSEKNS